MRSIAKSEPAKRTLTEEVREAAGDDAAERARERLEGEQQASPKPRTVRAVIESNRLLLVITFSLALMLGSAAALALGSWLALIPPLGFHAVLTIVVAAVSLRFASSVEKPDPAAAARLQEEGVADPEGELNDLIEDIAGEEQGSRAKRAAAKDEGEETSPPEGGAEAIANQQQATTPSSQPTTPKGG